jgi:hypothetical protein
MTADLRSAPPSGKAHSAANPWQQWWTYARTAAELAYVNPSVAPPFIEVYGPVLAADEVALLTPHATYSRFYGGDGSYQRSDLFAIGHPAVMIGVMAGSAIFNARRKAKARDAATPCWRSQQPCQIIATNHRLLCHIAAVGWLSFYYDAVTEFHPDLHAWTLTLGFDDQCAPLRISGPPVPALSLWAAISIEGPRWHNDPRLRPLLT